MKGRLGLTVAAVLVLVIIVCSYIGYYYFLYLGFDIAQDKDGALVGVRSGTFGDAFGTINALFSGLAFSGVIITLLMQRGDLAEQRKEASEARDQNHRQQTESQFYNMLNLQQQVVQGFDLHRHGPDAHTIQGRDCFRDWGRKLRTRYLEISEGHDHKHTKARALIAFGKIMQGHQGDLGLYFRSLYSIFRFIERSEHAHDDFALVVRSFLSDYELVMLFYNCMSARGEKFKRFAVAHALFDNLDIDLLIVEEHVCFMDREAFGENERALALWDKLHSEQ